MPRTKLLSATLAALLAGAVAADAATIVSNPIVLTSKTTLLNYNFSGQADLPLITKNSTLTTIESDWTFTPGKGHTGTMDLLANLYSPSFASGDNTGVGFSALVNLAGGPQAAQSLYHAQTGLDFSSAVVSTLVAGGHTLSTELVGAGAGFSNLDAFFAQGGTAVGTLKLVTIDSAGGGGGSVPEPASLLVWAAVAAGALFTRRRTAAV